MMKGDIMIKIFYKKDFICLSMNPFKFTMVMIKKGIFNKNEL